MMKEIVTINMDKSLEARATAMLVQVANRYDSNLFIEVAEKMVNLKSIMGVMSLGLDNGETVTLLADGSDEKVAVEGVCGFLTGVAS